MRPNRRVRQYLPPIEELEEVEGSPIQPVAANTPQHGHNNYRGYSDEENGSDDEAFQDANEPVNLLLFTSLDSYVLSVGSTEMASTSCIESASPYPHIFCPAPLPDSSTAEGNVGDNPPNQENDDVNGNAVSNNTLQDSLSPNDAQSTTRAAMGSGSISSAELSPIPRPRTQRRFKRRKNVPTPEPKLARRRLNSVLKIPRPSHLATKVSNKVIRYARRIRNMHQREMCCPNCGLLPMCPVTGQCGHTRCYKCIQKESKCPCGDKFSGLLSVNILIRDLAKRMTFAGQSFRMVPMPGVTTDNNLAGTSTEIENQIQPESGASESRDKPDKKESIVQPAIKNTGGNKQTPISPRARYNHALMLIRLGQHLEAAPHLALAAASGLPDLQLARKLLAQCVAVLSSGRDATVLMTRLKRSVRRLCSSSWIRPADIECILCCDTFTEPVTTPCGHMFCRTCLERTLDYRKRCPLCLYSLTDFDLADTTNTMFVKAVLESINANVTPSPLEPDLIPIFVCTVAYPSVPCPLFIFDPRYWLMIRRVLESGSRRFGMVACDRDQGYVDYGTILEVRDCVQLEDGRSILSTVGLSRFKVIERGVRDGCQIARILPITDVIPVDEMEMWDIRMLARQIMIKALIWLRRLNNKVLEDIESTFGSLPPREESDEEWWETTDGPSWLWWLVAVLPLRPEIKVLILSTDSLIKRMMAVSRTLEVVDQVTLTTTSPPQRELQGSVPSGDNQAMEDDQ